MKMEKDSIYSSVEKRKIHAVAPMNSSFLLITKLPPRRATAPWPGLAVRPGSGMAFLCRPCACPLGTSHLSWVSP